MAAPNVSDSTTPDERLRAIAQLLAQAVLRPENEPSSGQIPDSTKFGEQRQTCLDQARQMSLTVPTG